MQSSKNRVWQVVCIHLSAHSFPFGFPAPPNPNLASKPGVRRRGCSVGTPSAFIPSMVGRTKALQTRPNPENLWVCQLRWWRRIRLLVSWLSDRESNMDYLIGGPNVITRSYFHQEGRACVQRNQSEEFRAQKCKEVPSWCYHVDSCLDPGLKFWATQDFSFTWVKKINPSPFKANLNWSFCPSQVKSSFETLMS